MQVQEEEEKVQEEVPEVVEEPELPELPEIESDDEDRHPIYVPSQCLPNDLKKMLANKERQGEIIDQPIEKQNYWTIEKTMRDFNDLKIKF